MALGEEELATSATHRRQVRRSEERHRAANGLRETIANNFNFLVGFSSSIEVFHPTHGGLKPIHNSGERL